MNIESNYRLVSILSNLLNIYERCLYSQIKNFFKEKLSKCQCGFLKRFSVQQCLLVMIENWRKCQDKSDSFGALLADLLKAFDYLLHDLLIAKLYAYCFDMKSVKLIYSYPNDRKQRVKKEHAYRQWEEIIFGVPQGSILGPFLFNILVCNLVEFIDDDIDLASYSDGNTPYVTATNPDEIIKSLEKNSYDMLS